MKEKCLFLVNTPYQLMIAINLRKAEYANYDADVVITDNISDHKDLLDSVRCVGIFENVIAYNIKELYPDKNGVALARRLFGDKNIFDKAYDYYLFANLDHGASGIYRMLCKRNRHIGHSKIVNTIAASTFGVLLIHANSNTMRRWLWQDTFNNVGVYESGNVVIHAVVSVILIYAACTVIDICRIKLLEAPLMKKLK